MEKIDYKSGDEVEDEDEDDRSDNDEKDEEKKAGIKGQPPAPQGAQVRLFKL